MFKIFCRHKWNTLSKINSKKLDLSSLSFQGFKCPAYLAEKLLLGEARLIFSCEKCGKIIDRKYIGETND